MPPNDVLIDFLRFNSNKDKELNDTDNYTIDKSKIRVHRISLFLLYLLLLLKVSFILFSKYIQIPILFYS